MNRDGDIVSVAVSIIAYFFMIFIFSWIGEKIFYNFDRAALLLFDGHFFKGVCTLIIMSFAYYIAAGVTVEMNGGSMAEIIIVLLLLYSLGSDFYEYYKQSEGFFEGIATVIGYLLVSVDDFLKLFTLFGALSEKN